MFDQEINRINRMQDLPSHLASNSWPADVPSQHITFGSAGPYGTRTRGSPYFELPQFFAKALKAAGAVSRKKAKIVDQSMEATTDGHMVNVKVLEQKKIFALTPLDDGYFEPTEKYNSTRK